MFGYIDPGVGLLAWQAVVAFFVGALFFFKKARDKFLGLFRRECAQERAAANSNSQVTSQDVQQ